ncbi:MAG: hypothetical protein NVS9B15_06910 [Acidobacteriaceae bacterium]
MNKRSWILGSLLLVGTVSGLCADIPSFEMSKKPLAPEDPSMLLAGIGAAGIAVAYVRSKLRK